MIGPAAHAIASAAVPCNNYSFRNHFGCLPGTMQRLVVFLLKKKPQFPGLHSWRAKVGRL